MCSPRILWLGRYRHSPPLLDGAALYSNGLQEALAARGAELEVICLNLRTKAQEAPSTLPGITWNSVPGKISPRYQRALHWCPAGCADFATSQYRAAITKAMGAQHWDAVVLDSHLVAVHLPLVRALRPPRTPIIYLAHNYETKVRTELARDFAGSPFVRAALWLDAIKTRRLEARTVAHADLIVSLTKSDAACFRRQAQNKAVVTIRPGYAGLVAPPRSLTNSSRTVVILGSFEWLAKRANLESFLALSRRPFQKAGITIRVIGNMPQAYRRALAQRYPDVYFSGRVDDPTEELSHARMGLIVEAIGGGFKLKALDYAFARLPIASLAAAMEATPLKAGEHYIAAVDMPELIDVVVTHIDSVSQLEAMAKRCFDACCNDYQWDDRAGEFLGAVQRAISARQDAGIADQAIT